MQQIFEGINFIGINTETGLKLLLTLAFLIVLWLLRRGSNTIVRELLRGRYNERVWFWTGQAINLVTAVMFILGLLGIWFDNPNSLATAVGLVTAGVALDTH